MSAVIGWAVYAWAQAGEWLLAPLAIAAGWAAYRVARRTLRRAEHAARPDDLEQLWTLPAATHRNTRKETQ